MGVGCGLPDGTCQNRIFFHFGAFKSVLILNWCLSPFGTIISHRISVDLCIYSTLTLLLMAKNANILWQVKWQDRQPFFTNLLRPDFAHGTLWPSKTKNVELQQQSNLHTLTNKRQIILKHIMLQNSWQTVLGTKTFPGQSNLYGFTQKPQET